MGSIQINIIPSIFCKNALVTKIKTKLVRVFLAATGMNGLTQTVTSTVYLYCTSSTYVAIFCFGIFQQGNLISI